MTMNHYASLLPPPGIDVAVDEIWHIWFSVDDGCFALYLDKILFKNT